MVNDLQAAQVSPGAEHPSSEEGDGVVFDKIRAVFPSLTSQEVKGGNFPLRALWRH